MQNTALQDANFESCKIIGVDFSSCNDFLLAFSFVGCQLDYSIFHNKRIVKTKFKDCKIQEADFTQADLKESSFSNCNLADTVFYNTNLEKVDFRSSENYSIDPTINRIKKARFDIPAVVGLLDQYDIRID